MQKYKAAAYARYSTELQTENSIEYQLDAINKYCEEHDIAIVGEYIDRAVTGTTLNRPSFNNLIQDAQAGVFNAVVIYDISRGSRDVVDWFTFKSQMEAVNVKLFATRFDIGNSLDPSAFLMELMTVGYGQMEVLKTRERSRAGVQSKAKQGIFLGGYAPLGYYIENQQYKVDIYDAEIIKTIFNMYATGSSYKDITETLKSKNLKSGKPLAKTALHHILRNERYIGTYIWNENITQIMHKPCNKPNPDIVVIEGGIPPIIDKTTWNEVQTRLKTRNNASNKAKTDYILSGVIQCAECGAMYIGHTSTNQKGFKNKYYCCGAKYSKHTCHNKNIASSYIENIVIQELEKRINIANTDELCNELFSLANKPNTTNVKALKIKISKLEQDIDNLAEIIIDTPKGASREAILRKIEEKAAQLEDFKATELSTMEVITRKNLLLNLSKLQGTWQNNKKYVIKNMVKIYAQADGSFELHIGVHMNGSPCTLITLCTIYCSCMSA